MANIVYSIVGYINHLFFRERENFMDLVLLSIQYVYLTIFINSFIIQLEYMAGLFLSMCFPFTNG